MYGLAYQLSKSKDWGRVLRAGYGLFYDSGANASATVPGPYSTRCNNQAPCTLAPYTGGALATVPFPISVANERFVKPPVFPDSFTFPISQGTDQLIDPRFSLPYVHEMNVTLEQQIKGRQSLSVAYVGALGHHLLAPILYPPNKVNAAYLGNGTVGDSITVFQNSAGSSYHALQTKFQRQFSQGMGFITSYTWSHSIDTQSTGNAANLNSGSVEFVPTASQLANGIASSLVKASSDFDSRHNFALSVVYDTPRAGNSLVRAVLGHWTLAPIYHYQTAMPIDVITLATATLAGAAISASGRTLSWCSDLCYGFDLRGPVCGGRPRQRMSRGHRSEYRGSFRIPACFGRVCGELPRPLPRKAPFAHLFRLVPRRSPATPAGISFGGSRCRNSISPFNVISQSTRACGFVFKLTCSTYSTIRTSGPKVRTCLLRRSATRVKWRTAFSDRALLPAQVSIRSSAPAGRETSSSL